MTRSVSAKLGVSLALTAVLCALSYVLWDRPLLEVIRHLPPSYVHLGGRVSTLGRGEWYWAAGLSGAAAFWFVRRNYRLFHVVLYFCLSLALGGILSTVLKFVFGRCRPCLFLQSQSYGFTWLGTQAAETSLPSGHCVTVAAAATSLWFVYPPLRPLYLLGMAAMMSARLLAEAHYLSDVVAGTYLGIVAACIAFLLMRKWCGFGARDSENGTGMILPMREPL